MAIIGLNGVLQREGVFDLPYDSNGNRDPNGNKFYFSTYTEQNTDTKTLTTWLLYEREPNQFYKAAQLNPDGRWAPITYEDSQYYDYGEGKFVNARGSGLSGNVLGDGVLKDLRDTGPSSLNVMAVNNAKKTYRTLLNRAGNNLSNAQVNAIFAKNFKRGSVPPPNGQNPDGNPDPTDPTVKNLQLTGLDAGRAVKGSRNEIGTYAIPGASLIRYPENLSNSQDQLKIKIYKSQPRDINTETENATRFYDTRSRDRIRIDQELGGVILPAPGAIRDNNRVNWGGKEDNAIALQIANETKNYISGGSDAADAITRIKNNLMAAGKDLQTAASIYFSEQATGVSGLLARTGGGVLNPNLELLFQGPTLRPFNFTYKLSPRSPEEAKRALMIIRMFKQSMAVQRTTSNLFLRSPNLYRLSFVDGRRNTNADEGGDNPHKYLPRIKECALLSFNVNYTPDGTYATHWDSSMVSYELSFEFQELEPIFNDDYTELGNDETSPDYSIGY